MALCIFCGANNEANSNFCTSCGAKLSPEQPQSAVPLADALFPKPDFSEPITPAPNPVPAPVRSNPAPAPVHTKPTKSRRSFASVFFSIIICLLILLFLNPLFMIVTIRNAVNEESILSLLQRIDLEDIPASVLDSTDERFESESLAEYLCDELNVVLADEFPHDSLKKITPRKLDKALDETTILPFFAKHANGIVTAVMDGDRTYRISEKEIAKLLKKNLDYLEDELDMPAYSLDVDASASAFVESTGIDKIELYDRSDDVAEAIFGVIAIVFSPSTIIGLGILLFVMVLLLLLANRRGLMIAVRDIGIVGLLGTIIPVLLTVGSNVCVLVFAGENALLYLAGILISTIFNSSLIIFGSVFFGSIVLLVICNIVRKAQKKTAAVR